MLLTKTLPSALTVISNVAPCPTPLVPSLTVTSLVIGSTVVTVVCVTPVYVPAAAARVGLGAPFLTLLSSNILLLTGTSPSNSASL